MANSSSTWGLPGQGFRNDPATNAKNSNFIRNTGYGNGPTMNTPLGRVQIPPPPPPRPGSNSYSSYGAQGSYMSSLGYGGYGYGGSGYGYGYGYRPGFSSYGFGYGPNGFYGATNPETRFIQLAEESSRPAFQSIQSVLQAVNSLAMMFDSTFNALHSSYMSVIGVADNFGKLRSILGEVFSAIVIFKPLQWLFRYFLYFLGISKSNPRSESIWAEAKKKVSEAGKGEKLNVKPWLMMLFWSVITAGPYLLFKLMSHIYPNPIQNWNPAENPGSLAICFYDFHSSNPQELSFSVNQKLMVAPEKCQPVYSSGWWLACDENQRIGLVPKNYIGMLMESEKTGKTYIEHSGQKYNATSSKEAGKV